MPANEGLGCDDGQFCTTGDLCTLGACGGGPTDCSTASGLRRRPHGLLHGERPVQQRRLQ
jgi:hypothetical protein